jgi:protocatechuate 3,4-dioxygenase beta subunit
MTETSLTRRRALGVLGTVGLGTLLSACAGSDDPVTSARVPTDIGSTATVQPQSAPSAATNDLFDGVDPCTLTPEQTQGPYYFDVDAIRSDIREDREGVVLRLALKVQDADCQPISNAVVDVWHCDAGGLYSGFEAASTGRGGGRGRTDEETYLRGAQVTNADGVVQFTTVYPGWYRGRTAHIHAKVHLDRETLLTTQLYFDEEVTAQVYEREPYAANGRADTTNRSDGSFEPGSLLDLRQDGDGWLGVLVLGVRA